MANRFNRWAEETNAKKTTTKKTTSNVKYADIINEKHRSMELIQI